MSIQAHAAYHPGTTRQHNEDSWLFDPELDIAVVSDGITHPKGAYCSDLICKAIRKVLSEGRATIDAHNDSGSSVHRQALMELVRHSIETVSSALYLESQSNPEMKGVFATACVVLVSRGYAFIGHLGDSRVYSIREGVFHLLTQDHTYLAAMLVEGKSLEDARRVSYCNHLSAAVGYQPLVRASVQARELAIGERLLLCTDGLSDFFGPTSFKAPEWAGASSERLPALLRDHALKKNARDNLTAVIVDCDTRKPDRSRATKDIHNKLSTVRGVHLFQHFGERSLMKLLSLSDIREMVPGEALIHRGEMLNEMFIVLSGELSIDLGRGKIDATVKKGEVVGEMSLFEGSLPSATLVATKPTAVLTLHRDQLFQAMRADLEFAARFELGVLQAVIRRLRQRTEPDEELKGMENYSFVSILPPEQN